MQHLGEGMLLLICCVVAAQESRQTPDAIDESGQKTAPTKRRAVRSAEYVADCKDDAAVVDSLLHNYDKHKLPGGGNVSVNVEVSISLSIHTQYDYRTITDLGPRSIENHRNHIGI